MSKPNTPYGISYIASAPEELKAGDWVEVMYAAFPKSAIGCKGTIVEINGSECIFKYDDSRFEKTLLLNLNDLRKLPDTISFEEDSDNVKAFKAILNEMAETYKAKDADYGSAYDDGYRLFGYTQLLSRIYEKFSRVKHLLDGNKPNVAENIYDTLTDMSIQCIALRMLLQKNDFENVD